MRIGGTAEMAWMQICDPTDKEKGNYTMEISDGVKTHIRTFDLSGQGRRWDKIKLILIYGSEEMFCCYANLMEGSIFYQELFFFSTAYTEAYEEYLRLK